MTSQSNPGEAALSRKLLLAFGLPGLPLAAFTLPVYIHIPAYYAVDLGLGVAAVGFILLAARLWDVLTDPLIGWLSDHTKSRFGRRRPWIVLGAPVTLASVWLLFVPPAEVTAIYLLATAALLYVGWTMVVVPYAAWGAEITPNYHERTRVTATREGFVIVGTVLTAALFAIPEVPTRAESLRLLAIALIIVLPLCLLVLIRMVPDPVTPVRMQLSWRQAGTLLLENGPFARLLGAWLLNGIANGLPASLFLLYVDHRLALPDQSALLLLTYFLCSVIGLPFWLWLSGRIGKHRTWTVAMLWTCAFFVWAPALGAGDFWPFFGICVATGLALGADLSLPPSMQADVVDVDTAKGGGERTGTYFALWGMATKVSLAMAVGLAFPLLEWANFNPSVGSTATEGTLVLAMLYGLAPIPFKLAAIALVWRHPVDRSAQLQLRATIEQESVA